MPLPQLVEEVTDATLALAVLTLTKTPWFRNCLNESRSQNRNVGAIVGVYAELIRDSASHPVEESARPVIVNPFKLSVIPDAPN